MKRQEIQSYVAGGDNADDLELADCEEYFSMSHSEPIKEITEHYYDRTVLLKGPKSPLESQVCAVLPQNGNRVVTIDPHSVNCVHLTSLQQVRTFIWN